MILDVVSSLWGVAPKESEMKKLSLKLETVWFRSGPVHRLVWKYEEV